MILELGGINPVILDLDYSIKKAVERIINAKQTNVGQVCLNVDYVFVHDQQQRALIGQLRTAARKMVPDINSEDYTSVIDDVSMQRLVEMLQNAKHKWANVCPEVCD